MPNQLSELKNKNEDNLSLQFHTWLNKERGRQVKGIEYFLNKRSENTDFLILETAKEHKLNQISNLGVFTVGGYGRAELHPYSDIDLLLLSEGPLPKSDQKRISRTCNHIGLETKNARKWSGFPENGIAIGSDGFGNLIILTHNGDGILTDEIHFWNHEIRQAEKIAESINGLDE